MSTQRTIALVFLAGIAGLLAGRALPRAASKTEATASVKLMPPAPAGDDCKAERVELSSSKAQLAICKAYLPRALEAAPSAAQDVESEPPPPLLGGRPSPDDADQREENRRRLATYPEAVIVSHPDGRVRVYTPKEWPSGGDGRLLARKFPDGHIGWYPDSDAGPSSDPDAGRPPRRTFVMPIEVTLPDGTTGMYGVQNDPAVQEWLGKTIFGAGP
jgi:hypothetical protein